MKQNSIIFALILTSIFSLSSCNKDNKGIQTTMFNLKTEEPEGINSPAISNLTANFKNINTGKTITSNTFTNNQLSIELPEGMYHIDIEGDIQYLMDEKTTTGKAKGYKESVNITGETTTSSITLFVSQEKSDFVISEIFFTGTVTPEGKQYTGDKYFKIFNNSDSTLYADGLSILNSEFLTVTKENYTPDIMSRAMAVSTIITVPGGGKDYPVKPGKSIIISENAIDHLKANSQSFDLQKADFEFYYENSDDIDNPEVPNMFNTYGKLIVHNRGFRSFALARLGNTETFLNDTVTSRYRYEWLFVFGEFQILQKNVCLKVPNELIMDAVNLSIESDFQWIVTAPSLDMGWTHCGKTDGDKNRYGKSVRRKVLSTTPDGRQILKDSNNSTVDFEADAVPSLKK